MNVGFIIRAFPALLVGAALFLSGCAGLPPEEVPPGPAVQAEAYYRSGLDFLAEGLPERAMESFSLALVTDPAGRVAPAAMHRMAEIYRRQNENREAIDLLERLKKSFPGYEHSDEAFFLKVEALAADGQSERALVEGVSWAESRQGHSRYAEMSAIIGDMSLQAGNTAAGFRWWIEAHEAAPEDSPKRRSAKGKLDEILRRLEAADLSRVAYFATGTVMAPGIYHRMAERYFSDGDMAGAEEAALSLIKSSSDDEWVRKGKDILDRIREQLSVRGYLVGCILPQSGPFALYGMEVLRGIHLGLAMEAETADSARGGQDIEVVVEDSAGDPVAAEAGFIRLAREEKVIAVIGPLSSNAAEVVGEKSQKFGIPLIAITQKEDITGTGDMVFRNFIYPSREIKRLLDGAMGPLGMDRFAVLYPDNPYGRHFKRLFEDAVQARGGAITAAASYEPGTTDFAGSIERLTGLDSPRPRGIEDELLARWPAEREEMEAYADRRPVLDFDAVFIPDTFEKIAMLAPQLIYHDVIDVVLLGTSLWQSSRLLEQAAGHIQGAMFATGFFEDSSRPGVASFVENYRRLFGEEPGILAATGYDTIRFLAGLLAGRDTPTRINLRLAISDSPPFPGVTGDISFDETGEVEKEPFLITVHGRRFIEF